ncbi:DegV family protein [Silanimonas sp.]|jgi:DegV family protein with EDD domain|uniref:DegV family protein n=1 Tax=Silanimonas sp. TaxID=1929290 RepID=UPI0037C5DE23
MSATTPFASPLPPAGPIRAAALRHALIAGVRRVIARRDALNKINVFPVPDGDTGNNLALTLSTVLTGALQRRAGGVGRLLRRVGDEAIDGARGNSGAILAQFFSGLADAVGSRASLDRRGLAEAARAASRSARSAMADPKEGTMISVIHAFAEALVHAAEQGERQELRAWFESALAQARIALQRTPDQLPVLRKAGVVDAGAQGFVDLLEGIGDFLARRGASGPADGADDRSDLDIGDVHDALHAELDDIDPRHRWCTECLLVGEGLDRAGLQAAMSDLGADCVVVAGGAHRVKVHAHVARPSAMFEALGRFGRVESTKADDMLAQARTASAPGGCVVVTDSSADLPDGLADALNLHVIPLRVNFGEQDYLDRVGISPAEFYARLRHEHLLPRTSQPPVGDFRRQFDFLLSHHAEVVYIGLSRAVSGTLQAAEAAAQRGDASRTHVFDTANAAGGQALLAIAAAEKAATGAAAAEVLAHVAALKPKTLTFALARDIRHAVRGGRVPRWAGWIASVLRATPIARVVPEGRLKPCAALFGETRAPERFAAYVAKQVPAGTRWRLIVGHCDAADDAAALLASLKARLDIAEGWLVETGPAVGAHAGPGALVACLQPVAL